MANLSLTRVNQKLNQARVLIQYLENADLTEVERDSYCEASAFHLTCAYRHYLKELAETYHLKSVSGFASEEELINAFVAAKKYPVEASELLSLRDQKGSWLWQLQEHYNSLWVPPRLVSTAEIDHEHNSNLINLVEIGAEGLPVFDPSKLNQWLGEFIGLVQRHRQTSAEF